MFSILRSIFSNVDQKFAVHKIFEDQVRLTPKAIAVCDSRKSLTYRQLNEEANRVANLLVKSGVNLGDLVGLYIDQTTDLVVALLAVLKSGAAYLALDPAIPEKRKDYICKDSKVGLILSKHSLGLSNDSDIEVLFIEQAASYSKKAPALSGEQSGRHLAYVLYTSGSTGEPKGVEIRHDSLANVIQYRIDTILKKEERAVIPLTASLEFDASVAQIFTPLCSGGKLVVVDNIFELTQSAHFNEITCIGSTPSVVRFFMDHYSFPSSLKVLILGGENVDEDLCKLIWDRTSVSKLINLYGPTEATVHVTYGILFDREKSDCYKRSINLPITIGRPIKGNNIHVLNEDLEVCKIGEPGEIYLVGIGLARSYRNRAHLTKEKFLKFNVQGSDLIGYKTGDLGVLLENGEIEFLGRDDRQVKINGYRVELDEIEKRLNEHPLIKQSAVEFENKESIEMVVAYILLRNNLRTEESELFRRLNADMRNFLPHSMLPREYKILNKFPLTKNGKIDRRSLV